jgi:hypothetical protein
MTPAAYYNGWTPSFLSWALLTLLMQGENTVNYIIVYYTFSTDDLLALSIGQRVRDYASTPMFQEQTS